MKIPQLPRIEIDGTSALIAIAIAAIGFYSTGPSGLPIATLPSSAATGHGPVLQAIAREIQVRNGRSVFDLGCPKSYASSGGTGSVCCANQVSAALKAAGVNIAGSDAVMPLVEQLRAAGWTQVDIDDAPIGAVAFSNQWGTTETKNPGQHIELVAAIGATATAGSWGQQFQTHSDYATGTHRELMRKGGNFGGALIPPPAGG